MTYHHPTDPPQQHSPAEEGTPAQEPSVSAPSLAAEQVSAHETPASQELRQNCTKAFDSLYFCYSPFHQARNYYIDGQLDDCRARFRRLRLCLLSRLKPDSEAQQIFKREEQRELDAKNLRHVKPVWDIRPEFLENVRRSKQSGQHDDLDQSPKHNNSWWL